MFAPRNEAQVMPERRSELMMHNGNPRLLSIGDAATYLHLSRSLLYKYVAESRIPHIRIGRCIRFDMSELAVWTRNRSVMDVTSVQE